MCVSTRSVSPSDHSFSSGALFFSSVWCFSSVVTFRTGEMKRLPLRHVLSSTSQVKPAGQQCMRSSQQTACSKGQQLYPRSFGQHVSFPLHTVTRSGHNVLGLPAYDTNRDSKSSLPLRIKRLSSVEIYCASLQVGFSASFSLAMHCACKRPENVAPAYLIVGFRRKASPYTRCCSETERTELTKGPPEGSTALMCSAGADDDKGGPEVFSGI